MDSRKNSFQKVLPNSTKFSFNFSEGIKEIKLDNDGDLWILYDTKGIVLYSHNSNFIKIFSENYNNSKVPLQDACCFNITKNNVVNFIKCYFLDIQSQLWIGMLRGLFKTDIRNFQLTAVSSDEIDFSNETINQIYEDEHNNIWISKRGKGLFRFDREDNNWEKQR